MFIDNRSMPGFGILFLDVGKLGSGCSGDIEGVVWVEDGMCSPPHKLLPGEKE